MGNSEIITIVLGIVTSIGGVGAIIIAVANYLSKILADRYIEKVKSNFEQKLELYKNQLEINKSITLRYSNSQFEEYSKLWATLYDLKIVADNLWTEASEKNLLGFTSQLKKTKSQIQKAGLFIEDDDYSSLMKILKYFAQYEIGKQTLIQFKRGNYPGQGAIDRLIANNRDKKSKYEELILKIKADLRRQIKGEEIENARQ